MYPSIYVCADPIAWSHLLFWEWNKWINDRLKCSETWEWSYTSNCEAHWNNSFHSLWILEAISYSGVLSWCLSFHSSVRKRPVLGSLLDLVQMLAWWQHLAESLPVGQPFFSLSDLHSAATPSASCSGAGLCFSGSLICESPSFGTSLFFVKQVHVLLFPWFPCTVLSTLDPHCIVNMVSISERRKVT